MTVRRGGCGPHRRGLLHGAGGGAVAARRRSRHLRGRRGDHLEIWTCSLEGVLLNAAEQAACNMRSSSHHAGDVTTSMGYMGCGSHGARTAAGFPVGRLCEGMAGALSRHGASTARGSAGVSGTRRLKRSTVTDCRVIDKAHDVYS